MQSNHYKSTAKDGIHEKIRHILSDHVGYVLVTCKPTAKTGKLEVELSFDGDPDLASYLVDGAVGYFDEQHLEV